MFDYDDLDNASAKKIQPPPLGRKIRILGLHGGGSNSNIMRYQSAQLQRLLKDRAEWTFLDGTVEKTDMEVNDIMRALAKDKPVVSWYDSLPDDKSDTRPYFDQLFDTAVSFTYHGVDDGVDRVMQHITANGPYDILVGFSQGCIVSTLICGILRDRGEPVPWRLSVLFNGMRVRDQRFDRYFEHPLPQPVVMVFGKQDEFYKYGRQSQAALYAEPLILEHEEGHKFPTLKPRCTEIFEAVMKEILWHCGLGV